MQLLTRRFLLGCVFPFLCLFTLSAYSHEEVAPSDQHVVLISLDGFRHDYIALHQANGLAHIATQGVQAKALLPVYPANTFPNHISIVTGLLPINHGIVNNAFYDKSRLTKEGFARYKMGAGYQDSSWISAIPLWNLVEFHGDKAATFFWPESDARIGGALPSYHYHYSKYAGYQQRIDQIIQWLSLPDSHRPRFVAGYFSLTDSIGHEFGPQAPETKAAVQQVDALMAQLYKRLQALPIPVNLVIVSDHGMAEINQDAQIFESELAISDGFVIENEGAQISLYAKPELDASQIARETKRLVEIADGRFNVLSKQQRETRSFPKSPRTGDIVIEIAPPGVFKDINYQYVSRGGHGYVNTHPDMGGLFVAAGPAFKRNLQLPKFSNLEIYPALAEIMGLKLLSPIDGRLNILQQGIEE